LGKFEWSRLFTLSVVELKELAREGGEARFMILTIELCPMPSPKRSFQGKVKKTITRLSLEAYTPNNLPVGSTQLVLQEKVVFEESEVRRNPEEEFTKMDEKGNLKNGVRVEMNQLNLVVVEESAEEITDRRPNLRWKKEVNTTISFVLGVGISSLAVGHHYNTVRSGRKWLTTSLQISFSSQTNGWNRCGCEAAMTREGECDENEDGASAKVESAERLEEKW
jgi:hypothetical protein